MRNPLLAEWRKLKINTHNLEAVILLMDEHDFLEDFAGSQSQNDLFEVIFQDKV